MGSREHLQLTSLNLFELNFKLQRIADRLDAIEGLRGLPNMYGNLDMNLNKIVQVLDPTDANDAAILDTFQAILLTGLNAILGTLECDTLEVNTTSVFQGDASFESGANIAMTNGFIEITDSNGTIIHSFGTIT